MKQYRTKQVRPPIAIPSRATVLCGLRTTVGVRSCSIQYLDHAGHFREKPITFAAAARVLKWLGARRLSLPIQLGS
jgi:hypothetical protein